ncbi:Na+/H+ antiporter subunit B [Albibacterium sp.]|uniref:Na+/H+ antiporter subunit B n=1 Tax=Albibacterium sp. TaxID=2952885 RepID=UPI002BE3D5D8|nr:Na+/H+ antiporter subunit B [Albibacterium sp.]HUH17789.1 Na+/H+ antiporter subunit B [Albibacterium sp.]
MKIILLKTAANYLLPLLLLFSVFILLRGHYEPGGGFVGGLIASIAFILHSLANGLDRTKALLKYSPFYFIPFGLSIAILSGLAPMLIGDPFMTVLWFENPMPVIGLIGSALFFDIGVYLVVIGVTLTILFTISESV